MPTMPQIRMEKTMTNIKFQAGKAIAEHYRRDHGIATDSDTLISLLQAAKAWAKEHTQ